MRQFVSSVMPDKNGRVSLNAKERRYLIQVLRLTEAEIIEVRLPNAVLVSMQLHLIGNSAQGNAIVELVLLESVDGSHKIEEDSFQNQNKFWLFQFLPKGQKMDLIVRQATECGVAVIVPIVGEYSVGTKDVINNGGVANRLDRWSRIIREAQQQSGSPILTKVLEPVKPEQAITLWQDALTKSVSDTYEGKNLAFILSERQEGEEGLYSLLRKEKKNLTQSFIALAVGCEGGISPFEIYLFEKSGFMPIRLKTNILRTETAALYGLATLQTAIRERSSWMLNE